MNYLDTLNKEQREAVMHIDGPCLVVAGAGSGKTKVLTTRIAYLIESGIYSSNILAITFTNKAAKEMKDRISKIVSDNYSFVGTFHSFGLRVIKENYEALGLAKNFTIIDSDDVLSIIKKILKDLGYDIKQVAPSYIRNRISFIKNEMLSDAEIERYFLSEPEKIAKQVYYEYEKVLKKNNVVDFDDLLKLPVELFMKNADILDKYQEKYKYILIDEYQDTNEVQYKLVKLLSNKYRNIFVVGDQNQAIYGFRQANYKNILNFEKDYPDANVVVLNQNYRSTTTILNAANSVIKNNIERKEVNLFSELGEGVKVKYLRSNDGLQEVNLVINEIKSLLDMGYKKNDFAIFYRTNAQSRIYEEAMLKNNFPYKVVGSFYFYKRKEIKDLISYLKLIANHNDDISLKRVINEPKRGIGAKTIESLENEAEINGTSMYDSITSGKELEFKKIIEELSKEAENLSLTELIDAVLEKSGMKDELEKEKNLDSELRIDNLMEFRSITENYQNVTGSVNLEDFLDEISLIADISEHQNQDDAITLMTLHSAKGLEFKVVFMVGMEEGLMPHSNAFCEENGIEEERRLCYVGITRAKERLYLTNAKSRMLYGKDMMNPPSRFISEISSEYIESNIQEEKKINKDLLYDSENEEYKSGEVVTHLSFGRGVVIGVDERFVTVAFDKRFGIKKFLKNYKGLKKGK
ncbi:MAG: UvrD-helicase domain-containing protein [Bacilli bacterium]|nr:UvrD-helicase domain-containing protein [Bacilli bacterium]